MVPSDGTVNSFLFRCWELCINLFTLGVPWLLGVFPSWWVYSISALSGKASLHKSVIKQTTGECGNPRVEGFLFFFLHGSYFSSLCQMILKYSWKINIRHILLYEEMLQNNIYNWCIKHKFSIFICKNRPTYIKGLLLEVSSSPWIFTTVSGT